MSCNNKVLNRRGKQCRQAGDFDFPHPMAGRGKGNSASHPTKPTLVPKRHFHRRLLSLTLSHTANLCPLSPSLSTTRFKHSSRTKAAARPSATTSVRFASLTEPPSICTRTTTSPTPESQQQMYHTEATLIAMQSL